MIDGVKLVDYEEVDHNEVKMRNLVDHKKMNHIDVNMGKMVKHLEVDDVEEMMRKLVDMWGNMKQGNNSRLSVAVVCPVCPDQVVSSYYLALQVVSDMLPLGKLLGPSLAG